MLRYRRNFGAFSPAISVFDEAISGISPGAFVRYTAKVPARCKPRLSPGQTSKSFNGETNYSRCRYTHLHGHGSWISVTCPARSPPPLAPFATHVALTSRESMARSRTGMITGRPSSFEAWKLKNLPSRSWLTDLNASGSDCRARARHS